MKLYLLKVFFLFMPAAFVSAQANKHRVSAAVMESIYENVKTPYKYGLVIVPQDDSKKTDCPTVFRKNGQWHMTYLVFDGRGYETWLAKSGLYRIG